MRRVILCDFDGTITINDITNTLCIMHIPERWEEVEQQWLDGKISATECYELEYQALNLTKREIDAFLETVEISPGTAKLLAVADELGWEFHVLSAGFDYYIERVLARHGIKAAHTANSLRFDSDGKPVFRFRDNFDPDCHRYKHPCAGCKPATWRSWKSRGYTIAYVGDGTTDFCMADSFKTEAEEGDLLFAKDKLLDYCRENGIAAIPFDTLGDVATSLARKKAPERVAKAL